ncbi:ZP domain-containing protein-like [Boleophthalmus pectinirostris]|uniref:ZP domain-containing protein-like n=1 Tax=Boleophthalmus pectinirostris TaxID=150288 RepID=UPI00242E9F9C|nr:ZP domain-containing protein-like [Boleophthalmus pectinirostris]
MTTSTHLSTLVSISSPYSGAPFSQLPVQFTFQVDPPAPSCTEGDYLPKFVSPTPLNGEILMAEARKEMEITVKAVASYSVPDDIIMSGPLNVTKHRTTADEFTIRWTPIDENMGHYFPICFAVEFTYGFAIYQTEMRCVIVKVRVAQSNTVVTCLESSMIVEVEKATLPPLHYQDLRLSDPSNTVCSLQSNSTHVVAIVPLNACGTQIEEDDDDLLFKNEITTVDNRSTLITRKHMLEIKFFCQYSKRGNVTATFSAHRENVTVWDKGFGKFTYGFEFFPDQRFVSRIDPRLYPLEYDVGDRIFMEIEATTIVNNTELFVESCRAAPYDNPNYPHPYSLIENGCNLDSTLIVYTTINKKQFKFSIEAFKFIGLHDKVYISCSVLMCEAGNPHTRCSQGCLPNATTRAKREAVIESGIHYVSQGPLRLKRSVQAGNTGLSLNLVFIAGSALVAVGMICGVFLYKTKTSSFKYQLLSSEEN